MVWRLVGGYFPQCQRTLWGEAGDEDKELALLLEETALGKALWLKWVCLVKSREERWRGKSMAREGHVTQYKFREFDFANQGKELGFYSNCIKKPLGF